MLVFKRQKAILSQGPGEKGQRRGQQMRSQRTLLGGGSNLHITQQSPAHMHTDHSGTYFPEANTAVFKNEHRYFRSPHYK